ncbi:MAG: hypothetical protein C4563_04570 [Desulfobulbus sp.]|nr:MAG: hypothetical protein C4563_04570 [Desulfobulbus sp.]
MSRVFLVLCCLMSLSLAACTRHEVEIKPIHITVDVNVRVEKAVDDFYGDIYGNPSETNQPKK